MGYFDPIGKKVPLTESTPVIPTSRPGIGAVFYLEHTRHLFPELGEGDEEEVSSPL